MHVVFVTPYFSPKVGGLENYALQIAQGLIRQYGWEISVITSNHELKTYKEDSVGAIKVYRLQTDFRLSNTPVGLHWKSEIRDLLKKLQPDLVNAHTPVPYISDLAVQAAHQLKIPTVLTYQNDIFKENIILKLIGNLYYLTLGTKTFQIVDKIIVSSAHYANISKYLQPYQNKIAVVSPGVTLHHLIDIPNGQTRNEILFVAQLDKTHRHKGLEYLLSAVSIISKKYPDLRVIVIGKGDDKDRYFDIAKSLEIEGQVDFKGYVPEDQMPDFFARALCLCLPSISQAEGFGMVILEAATQKTPSIGSDVGGIPAVIIDGETGLLVPPKDSRRLAEAVSKLYEDQAYRDRLGENAYTRARKEFTWDVQIEKTKQLFGKIAHS